MTQKTKTYAAKLLDRLIELDHETGAAYYEMGQILSSIMHGKLYDLLGYGSMGHLVEEEMSFTPSTAQAYMRLYDRLKELKYNKTEALNLIKQFGITNLNAALRNMKAKTGARAIRNRIRELDHHQLNFTLNGAQLDLAMQALEALGAKTTDTGRMQHSTEAFMEMVEAVVEQRKAA